MINNCLVSIVLATYRRYDGLKIALESLLNQTYKNIEIVIVDDNADSKWQNNISNLISGYNDERIVLLSDGQNRGSAKARNFGIEQSKGEYVSFLDDDDVYLPNKIENQLAFMQSQNADYCIEDLDLYFEDGKLSEHRKRYYIKETDKESLLKYHLKYHLTGTDTMMFKREYLLKIGMFPPIDVGDEYYLMMQAILHGGKFCYFNECDIKAVVHSKTDGLSSGEKKIQGENNLYATKKKYFSKLSRKEVRYIKARHYLVLAFAELRRKKFISLLKHGLCALFISPFDTFAIVFLGR